MKLRLVMGRAGAGKTRYCLTEIGKELKAQPEGPSLVMILPEHATFQAEKELAGTPGIKGFMRAYVFGFCRLAYRVLQETGGAVRPHISELGKKLVLGQLLREYKDQFKVFHQAARQPNFSETVAGLLQEFKNYNVTPEKMAEVTPLLEGTPTGDKLHDLALLYQGFEEFLAGRYTDPEDYLSLVAERISQSEILRGAQVWIDGFTWFNPQEAKVVCRLLETASCVTVTLCLGDKDSPEHEKETSLFHRQWNTRKKLWQWAKEMGVSVEEVVLSEGNRFSAAPWLAHVEQQFFAFPPRPLKEKAEGVSIVEAANRRAEAEGIARDMLRLAKEEGYRWRDMGILLGDAENYSHIFEQVLADYDIPFFSDRKRHPVHHPLAELLRSALEVADERWNYDAVFRCLKTDFFPVSRQEVDRLENYVLEFGIRGYRWTQKEAWQFVRRLSLDEDAELSERQQNTLEEINRIRRKAAQPLLELAERLNGQTTVKEYTLALYRLLETLEVPELLQTWADRAEAGGDLEQALEHRQMWDCLVELLEQLVETCGEQELPLRDYRAMLEDGLEGLTLSLIPPGLDYVTVSPLEDTSLSNVQAIYIPGVNDGVLPARGRGEGLLTDDERSKILACGVELAPGAQADTFAERFLTYTALTRSRHYLWVSYPLADEEGKGLNPSLVISRLRKLTGQSLLSLPAEPKGGDEQHYISHPRKSISALAHVLRDYKKGEPAAPLWWDVYNWALAQEGWQAYLKQAVAGLFHWNQAGGLPKEVAKRLYVRNERIRGSVTRFESFRACPFKHFAQYGLSLKERAVFKLEAPDLGQFFHAVLKGFGERLKEEGRSWGSVEPEECTRIIGELVEALAPRLQNEILLSSEQHRHLSGRLKERVAKAVRRLTEFDRISQFKPYAFEQSFGRGKSDLPPLVYMLPDQVALEVAGQIDRLDMAEAEGKKYMLVIDYKSGGAWIKVVDVYHGLKLQLLTYLLAASRALPDCVPAGVLYYFLKNPVHSAEGPMEPADIEKEINKLLKMPGWVLADSQVVRLVDGAIDGYSEFLKIALKKDGEFYSTCLSYVKSAEEFSLLLAHVEKVLVETAQSILSGDIAIEPYSLEKRTPCAFCSYSSVCQFDRQLEENAHRMLSTEEEPVLLEKMRTGKEQEA